MIEDSQARLQEAAQWADGGAALTRAVSIALSGSGSQSTMLEQCTEALVEHLGAAFARIWTLNRQDNVLELEASAGLYTHLDGPHGRVPLGSLKIGLIAEERQPHLTNDVLNDPRVGDHDWAKREGLVSFAGYPLLIGDRLIGVIAMFARQPLAGETSALLGSVADMIAQGIERRRAEAARTQLLIQVESIRKRLDDLLTNVPGVVWEAWGEPDASSQRIDFVSEYVETMLGYSVQEWLSTPNFWLTIVHPADQERAAQEAAAIFASGKGGSSEFRWIARDGRVVWVEAQSLVILDSAGGAAGMRGVTMDITPRKRVEDGQRFLAEASAILVSSLDFESTLASVARLAVPRVSDWCAIDLLHEDQRLVRLASAHVDPSKVELAGELERRHPTDLSAEYGVAQVIRSGQSELMPHIPDSLLVAAARDEQHLELIRSLGLRSYLAVPLLARGRVLGVLTLVSAESGQVYGPADLALAEDLAGRCALAVDNARLYRDVQRELRTRDEFIASASHDLKNPLASIKGVAQLLQRQLRRPDGVDPERLLASLGSIDSAANRMVVLINTLLDVARQQMGETIDLERQPTDLVTLAQQVVVEHQQATERHRLRLESTLPGLVGQWDKERLERALANLVGNALKYSPDGGEIIVTVERRNESDGDWAVLAVQDQGVGIPASDLSRIFDRFQRADNVIGQISGTGIGLADVRQIIELHGGTIRAASEPGSGATFTLRLPL